MFDSRRVLVASLALLAAAYAVFWIRAVRRRPANGERPKAIELAIGAVTNFFDTLGIGSFAPTTSIFKFRRLVPDERIPGTLNVGHTLPTVTEALLFISIVEVDSITLVAMIAASVLGRGSARASSRDSLAGRFRSGWAGRFSRPRCSSR